MLLGTLGVSLLGNLLAGKVIVKTGSGNRKGKGIVRAGSRNKKRKRNCKSWLWKIMLFLMPPPPLTNFEIQNNDENEPRLNRVFSRDNMPKEWGIPNKS